MRLQQTSMEAARAEVEAVGQQSANRWVYAGMAGVSMQAPPRAPHAATPAPPSCGIATLHFCFFGHAVGSRLDRTWNPLQAS